MLPLPLNIVFEITQKCNYNCIFCGNPFANTNFIQQNNAKTSKKSLFDVAERIAQSGVFMVSLSGGEPLLSKNIFELISVFLSNNVQVTLNTNLTLISVDDINKLKSNGVDGLLFSFHSYNPTVFNEMVGNARGFDEVVNKIRLCLDNGLQVTPNMVVNQQNIADVKETAFFLRDNFGIDVFCASPMGASKVHHQDKLLSIEQLKTVFDDLNSLTQNNIYTRVLKAFPYCLFENPEPYVRVLEMSCAGGNTMIAINEVGDVRYCSHSSGMLGNILKDPLESILLKFDYTSLLPDYCKVCRFSQRCRSGCLVETELFKESNPYHNAIDKTSSEIFNCFDATVNYIDFQYLNFTVSDNIRFRSDSNENYILVDNINFLVLNKYELRLYRALLDEQKAGSLVNFESFLTKMSLDREQFNLLLNKFAYSGFLKY